MSFALAALLDGPILHGGTQILVRDDGMIKRHGRFWALCLEPVGTWADIDSRLLPHVDQGVRG